MTQQNDIGIDHSDHAGAGEDEKFRQMMKGEPPKPEPRGIFAGARRIFERIFARSKALSCGPCCSGKSSTSEKDGINH